MTCLYRINCGHAAGVYADRLGQSWLPDQELTPDAEWGAIGGRAVHCDDDLPPAPGEAPGLYRSERYAMSGYEFRVPDATYEVRLHFAETFESHYRARFRRFDVGINGVRLLREYEPFAVAGGFNRPAIAVIPGVGAPNGRLSIELLGGAMINAIEIHRTGTDAVPARERKRLLFIGNSHVLFWELGLSIENHINARPNRIHLHVERELHGGRHMSQLYDTTDARRRVAEGGFDHVVVQSMRMEQAGDEQVMTGYARKWHSDISATGARMLLYCTFPKKEDALPAYDAIIRPHRAIARELGMTFVPACSAWKLSLTRRPDLRLFNISDDVHTGLHGAYLTACVFWAVLTGGDPVGRVPATMLAGQVPVDAEMARYLQEVARDTVSAERRGVEL
jgi:hypothetical protein